MKLDFWLLWIENQTTIDIKKNTNFFLSDEQEIKGQHGTLKNKAFIDHIMVWDEQDLPFFRTDLYAIGQFDRDSVTGL